MKSQVTVAIPTYGRERVLVDTLAQVLALQPEPAAVLVVDQTQRHEPGTERQLSDWAKAGAIAWVRLERPSTVHAMNTALLRAATPYVLFLDDDIVPAPGLLGAHEAAFLVAANTWAVAGQVLQPGEEPCDQPAPARLRGLRRGLDFRFNSARPDWVFNVMAGNLCVRRQQALALGGFDENFIAPVAYRFETEFAHRLLAAGGRIRFEPQASIRHLRAASGGTRTQGSHLTSPSPVHGVGDYYFALRQAGLPRGLPYMLRRPIREVCTRYHARHPWWIPVKLVGELRAMVLALRLWHRGPKFLSPAPSGAESR